MVLTCSFTLDNLEVISEFLVLPDKFRDKFTY